MKNAETSQATLEKVREMRHRREHDESTTFDGLSHEDIWQIASLVESQAKKLEEMSAREGKMRKALENWTQWILDEGRECFEGCPCQGCRNYRESNKILSSLS